LSSSSTPAPLTQGRNSPRLVIFMLSLLMGLQPLSTDLYLPAMPAMSDEFGVPVSQAQYTLSAMLLAYGVSQLLWGPLSDRFGRRPVLLWGLGAYVLASVGCTWASSLGWLVFARMCQGAALGAAVMTARAVVRDRHSPAEGARVMSQVLTGLGLIACMSAPVGGLLSHLLDWRAALAALAVFSALTLGVVLWRFEESIGQSPAECAGAPRNGAHLAAHWPAIPGFWHFSAVASASNAGLFTYLATSSFVLMRLHGMSQLAYGFCMSSMSLCYVLGTVCCRQGLKRVGLQRTLDVGGALSLGASLLLAGLYFAEVQSIWAVVLPLNLFMFSHGIHQPCSQMGAIAPFPEAAGTAAALNGFCMTLSAFLMGLWLGQQAGGSALPLVQGMLFWGMCLAVGAWVLVRRLGMPPAEPAPQ
jgi:MFS transporter, DHA1 family, multidrug resistance protein